MAGPRMAGCGICHRDSPRVRLQSRAVKTYPETMMAGTMLKLLLALLPLGASLLMLATVQ